MARACNAASRSAIRSASPSFVEVLLGEGQLTQIREFECAAMMIFGDKWARKGNVMLTVLTSCLAEIKNEGVCESNCVNHSLAQIKSYKAAKKREVMHGRTPPPPGDRSPAYTTKLQQACCVASNAPLTAMSFMSSMRLSM